MYTQNALLAASVGLASSPLASATPIKRQLACTTAAIPHPKVFGAEILNLTAAEYHDQTILSSFGGFPANLTVSYCGLNVSYTHPGWNDTINVAIWLPLDGWNGRFQGTGGGGYMTTEGPGALVSAVSDGYAAAGTDGGHAYDTNDNASPANWALLSPGNLNYPLLQDFAAVALSDMTLLGQEITKSYYGQKPAYSYWTGCSTGGRQGLMLAQRYPELYDGILAVAPAINWDSLLVTLYWAQQVMNDLGVYPPPCELQAFTSAAIAACDDLDGLKDGIISDAKECTFDPHTIIGKTFTCDSANGTEERQYTSEGATVAEAAWTGPIDPSGKRQWYGLNKDASLSGMADTTENSTKGLPLGYSYDWIKYYLAKDADFVPENMTNEEYFRMLHQSRNQYSSIIGTSDPDLSAFKARKGKLITWHGLADQLIMPNGTVDYYERISDTVADVHDFYRFFEAPGVAHCAGGAGPQPVGELEALARWVEQGVAPDELSAVNTTLHGEAPAAGQTLPTRKLCVWPKTQKYNGGDPLVADSFDCV